MQISVREAINVSGASGPRAGADGTLGPLEQLIEFARIAAEGDKNHKARRRGDSLRQEGSSELDLRLVQIDARENRE